MEPNAKLYVIVRSELAPGLACAQAVHAARLFLEEHPIAEREWYECSSNLAILEAPDECAIESLATKADSVGVHTARFREPDLGGSLTAIAISPEGKKLVRHLPLALSSAAT